MILDIRPELAEKILSLAQARGQDVDLWLTEVVDQYTSEKETLEQTVDRVIEENKQLLNALADR